MRFRKDKDESGAVTAGPPDATTRVAGDDAPAEPPTEALPGPPDASERVEEPTEVKPPAEHASGDAGPQSPAADAAPPSASDRVDAPPPSAGERVDTPAAAPPSPGDRVDAPPPSPSARLDGPGLPGPPPAGAVVAPPPQPGQLVSAAPPAAGVACPQCGSPAEAGQEMCIVCGSRIAAAPAGGKPRGWLLPAMLAGLGVLLIGTAVAFGVVELTSDDDVKKDDVADLAGDPNPPPPATNTQPQPPANTTPTIPPASGPNTQPEEPSDQTQPTEPDTTTPSQPSTGAPAEWPAGRTAYTVVLVSATSRNAADAKAEQAIKRGIKAGVLRSDDFSSLRPGYWVVFAGQYDTSEQATRAADRYAAQGFGGGYPRQVKPK